MDHTVCTSLGGRNHRCCSSRPLCCIRGRSHRLQTVVVLPQAKCVPQVANLCAAQRMHLTCSMRCPCTRFCACHSVCSTHATQQGTELSYTTTLHSSTQYGSQRRDAVTHLWVVFPSNSYLQWRPPLCSELLSQSEGRHTHSEHLDGPPQHLHWQKYILLSQTQKQRINEVDKQLLLRCFVALLFGHGPPEIITACRPLHPTRPSPLLPSCHTPSITPHSPLPAQTVLVGRPTLRCPPAHCNTSPAQLQAPRRPAGGTYTHTHAVADKTKHGGGKQAPAIGLTPCWSQSIFPNIETTAYDWMYS